MKSENNKVKVDGLDGIFEIFLRVVSTYKYKAFAYYTYRNAVQTECKWEELTRRCFPRVGILTLHFIFSRNTFQTTLVYRSYRKGLLIVIIALAYIVKIKELFNFKCQYAELFIEYTDAILWN